MTGRTREQWQRRGVAAAGVVSLALAVMSCADVGTGPEDVASVEFAPLDVPSVVLGDTLRDATGAIARIGVIVRNAKGDVITGVPVRYLYAEFARDSALAIDSVTGLVRALRAAKPATGEGNVIAQIGGALQILRPLVVTTRPDSIVAVSTTTPLLNVAATESASNRSEPLQVRVRHVEPASNATPVTVTEVNAWTVRFEVVQPANASNDTTALAWLVNDNGRASVTDTTDASGTAGRRVRIRASLLPMDTTTSEIRVRATTTYRGRPVTGSPVTLLLNVRRAR
ncbi:MAG TPA: hypothetical protein VE869_00075 [Gemmatimonas sp.]|nr:hypothetical protein [Gemmatimonas sp.]